MTNATALNITPLHTPLDFDIQLFKSETFWALPVREAERLGLDLLDQLAHVRGRTADFAVWIVLALEARTRGDAPVIERLKRK